MDIDVTFLFQLGMLLTTLVVLNGVLLRPFLGVIEAREAKIEGARDKARDLELRGNAHMEQYQAQMRQARFKAAGERDAIRTEARAEERKMLAQVRNEIAEKMNVTRKQLTAAEAEAGRNLSAQTEALARQLVAKVLGREVSS
jgi:F-type H+-transporting ATPase subunit b